MQDDAAKRLRLALDLFDAGLELMRQKIRRETPGISDDDLERQIRAWLCKRPGAEFGDAVGRPVEWPRR